MSSYSNGQTPYGPPNDHTRYQNQPVGYLPPADHHDQWLRRSSSYDAGDDVVSHNDHQYYDNRTSTLGGGQGGGRGVGPVATRGGGIPGIADHGGAYPGHWQQNNYMSQQGQYAQSSNEASLPLRTTSIARAMSGYEHQQQDYSIPGNQQPYNPSHFQQPQTTHSSQSYGAPAVSYQASGYQAYNPAAYQSTPVQPQQPQYYGQPTSLEGQTLSYIPGQPSMPLPPPPRQNEEVYASYPASSTIYQNTQYQSPPATQYPTPSSSGSAQSSPPPPPPPAHDPYVTSYTHSHPPRPYSHTPSISPRQSPQSEYPAQQYQNSYQERPSSLASRISPSASSAASHPSQTPQSPASTNSQPPPVMPHRAGTVGRHPQQRPLPGPPSNSVPENDYFGPANGTGYANTHRQDESGYDDLMREVEAAIHQGRNSSTPTGHRPPVFSSESGHVISAQQDQETPTSTSPRMAVSPDERPTHIGGGLASTGEQYINYAAFSDDSDAEAAAGVAAMQAAEEQEAAEAARRQSGSSSLFGQDSHPIPRQEQQQQQQDRDVSSDSDYANVDMGLVGGGYEANMSYGDEPVSDYAVAAAMQPEHQAQPRDPRMGSIHSSGRSSDGRSSQTSGFDSIPAQDAIHPFPPFRHMDMPRVDTAGTGGLIDPSPHPRRLSFEDGDESTMVDAENGHSSETTSPSKDGMPDLFFFPGMNQQRPLPPAPAAPDPSMIPYLVPAGTFPTSQGARYDANGQPYPVAPNDYVPSSLNPSQVPRSTSLASTRTIPRADQPIRSKTDADRARSLKQQSGSRSISEVGEVGGPASTVLDLPAIPRKKFNPAKLTKDQCKKCDTPWALSSIVEWIRDMAEDETDLKQHTIVEAIVALFTFAVPTMNMTDAECLGDRVVKEMLSAGALLREEEWVKLGSGAVSGVLFQLTQKGCYSPKLHEPEIKGKCYSYHCMRTLRKVDLSLIVESDKIPKDWIAFHNVKKEDLQDRDKKEIERQNVLHEIITTEVSYMASLDIVRTLYRDALLNAQPPVIQTKRLASFCRDAFGKIDEVKKVNEEHLLAQLKYRQRDQGPWIPGFSDIFREWIRKAKLIYVDYASCYPHADFMIRKEMGRNVLFKHFLDQARDDARSRRLEWDSYLKSPITRLQRYGLLLSTVLKNTVKESEEKMNLQFAIDEIKTATHECNARVDEMNKKRDLLAYKDKLKLRRDMEKDVVLNLDHLGRELIRQGDLLRAGGKGFQWVDTHAVLFDHYFVLAKSVVSRDSNGGTKYNYYDVSKYPIPMDLIVLESSNDDPVIKGSVKSMSGISSISGAARGVTDPRLSRTTSALSGGSAPAALVTPSGSSTKDNSSVNKTTASTSILESSGKDDKIIYPFKVKHLGKSEVYTLYAPSFTSRTEWCEAIVSAKTSHAAALFAQNAEPFRLRVLADTAFAYDSISGAHRSPVIRGTPLDRAIEAVEKKYRGQPRPTPVCRAAINCATTFYHPPGRLMCAIGTDYGVYFSEYDNPRGWSRTIQMSRVTQLAVFEEFNLFLLISDKSLIAYHLDMVSLPAGAVSPPDNSSARKAPQKLSGNKDVGFFATGRMKDRALVFYKKRDGISSTFKVLEPILHKSSGTRSRFLPTPMRRGHTDFFRDFDEFYIPAECYGINLFHSSLAVSTARGVEVLTLDKKQPWSVPNLQNENSETQAHLSSIAARIKDLKPLGMFRLSEAEFLVAFSECAVYVNKHGDVSRGVVMEFVAKAASACLCGQYLVLFDDDFVEIRNAMNGRMKQVIAGKDIKMLDDGGGSNSVRATNGGLGGGMNGLGLQGYGAVPRTVKISMQNPEHERNVVIVELIENEGTKD